MPKRSISLTEDLDRFVESEVKSGRFSNASEVVREGLRLMEARDSEDRAKLEWLRRSVKEGLEQIGRGEGVEIASGEELEVEIDRIGKEAEAEFKALRKRA